MPSTHIVHSSPFPWGAEAESSPDPLLASIARLRSWIDSYVPSQLGSDACGNDFVELLYKRVSSSLKKRRQDGLSPEEFNVEVRNSLRLLVHEEQQKIFRRSKRLIPVSDVETLPDPTSLEFAEHLDVAAEARAFLERIPEDLIPVVRHLYGLDGEKVKSRKQLAKDLGLKVNTLNQRLRRVYEKLRAGRE
jgi:hypothetical protein